MADNEFPKGGVFKFDEEIQYSPKSIVSRTAIKRSTGNVSVFAFDQGEELSEHTAPFDALVQVIDGSAEVIIDGKPLVVSKGECVIMPANITHALIANDKFKMILTMIKG